MAGALLFDEKIRQSPALQYFGLDCGMMKLITSHPPIVDSPAFLEPSLVENMAVFSPYSPSAEEVGEMDFLYESAQNFEVFSNIQD